MRPLSRTVLSPCCRKPPSAPSAFTSLQWRHQVSALCRTFSTARAAHISASTPPPLTAQEFATITPLLLLRELLQQHTELDGIDAGTRLQPGERRIVISRAEFRHFCATAQVEDPEAALADLAAAGVVVVLDGGNMIHLRPLLYLETLELIRSTQAQSPISANETSAVSSKPSMAGSSFMLEEAQRRVAELSKEEEMRDQLRPAIARVARWRRTVWGGALLYAGAQLAI
ncbi:hypothetical protein LSCM1_03421 [Leishmania martiniquensis]|uniref:Calcium uniporter protein n=1 Tax=Leishmania martiniquensis TaxID=1580590 RepID=A0A836H564_9TRYP|nr:hypothetical protein LSCM1_03421 [Leishmania martiniquensis]